MTLTFFVLFRNFNLCIYCWVWRHRLIISAFWKQTRESERRSCFWKARICIGSLSNAEESTCLNALGFIFNNIEMWVGLEMACQLETPPALTGPKLGSWLAPMLGSFQPSACQLPGIWCLFLDLRAHTYILLLFSPSLAFLGQVRIGLHYGCQCCRVWKLIFFSISNRRSKD